MDLLDGLQQVNRELNEDILGPRGLTLTQVYDETEYIYSSVDLVQQNIWVGGTLAAVILLLAIVAAITLTMRRRPGLKVQNIARQVAVSAKDRIRVVKMDAEKKQ